ncbi:MAG: sigma 54-interacting transcriptional regulator [Sorangiineae bacterium]|nr:sigma 54-interacting transcriptional regulator [Polyangiaceae bacterium]MEB2323514.1 sigma 54-interacting transcriptional regulator [Sorangiineae bacterium]
MPRARDDTAGERLGLVIAWSQPEPGRVGEVALLPAGGARLLGRGEPSASDPLPRLRFTARRPDRLGGEGPARSITGSGVSREQATLSTSAGRVEVERRGRCPMRLNGELTTRGVLRPGDTLTFEGELVLLCINTRATMAELAEYPAQAQFPFGGPDRHGIVGESAEAWALRDRLAFLAGREGHVLLLGESGSGKELAAQALHALSRRAGRRLLARNAATLPPGLIDAELFGNARNYPNPGMVERTGLIGEADGSTLFLDELGELASDLQSHLLRVLDSGEYQRLGDPTMRRSDVRVLGATNRPAHQLKHDLFARLELRVTTPPLGARREDIPLIARALLRRAAARDAKLGERFFEGWDGAAGEPRLDPRLVERLVRHSFTHHARELAALVWSAMAGSRAHFIALTPEVDAQLAGHHAPPPPSARAHSPDAIQACLDRHRGNQERASRELGLSSRDALYRLIKKHGLVIRR